MIAHDAQGNEFAVGDWADHVSGDLDPRRVTKVCHDNVIEIELLGGKSVPVNAENYNREKP